MIPVQLQIENAHHSKKMQDALLKSIAETHKGHDITDLKGREIVFTDLGRGYPRTFIIEEIRQTECVTRELIRVNGPLGGEKWVRGNTRRARPYNYTNISTLELILKLLEGEF